MVPDASLLLLPLPPGEGWGEGLGRWQVREQSGADRNSGQPQAIGVGSEFRTMRLPESTTPNEIPLRPRLRGWPEDGSSPAAPSSGSEHDFVPDPARRLHLVLNRDLTPMPRVSGAEDSPAHESNRGRIGIQDDAVAGGRGAERNSAPTPIAVVERRSSLQSPATPSSGSEHDFVRDPVLRWKPRPES